MDTLKAIAASPYFKEGAFILAVLLLLGGFKFGIEASIE